MDHIIDNKIEPLVIHLSDKNDSKEELVSRNQKKEKRLSFLKNKYLTVMC